MNDAEIMNQISGFPLNSHLPGRTIDDNVFLINEDFSIAVGWKIDVPNTSSCPQGTLDEIQNRLSTFLLSVPEYFDIQCVHTNDSRSKESLESAWGQKTKNVVQSAYIEEKRTALSEQYSNGQITNKSVYFFLIAAPHKENKVSITYKGTLFQKCSAFLKDNLNPTGRVEASISQLDDREKELELYATNLHGIFESLQFRPHVLESDDFVRIFYKRYNPFQYDQAIDPIKYRPDQNIPLPEYFLENEFEWSSDGTLRSGDAYFKIFSLSTPPASFDLAALDLILYSADIPTIEQITYARQGDIEKRKKALKTGIKRMQVESDDMVKIDNSDVLQQHIDERQALASGNEKVWLSGTFFLIWAQDTETLKRYTIELLKKSRESDIILQEEKRSCFNYWKSTHYAWTRDRDRYRELTFNTVQMVSMLPLCGAPTNLEQGKVGSVFEQSVGALYNFNGFDKQRFSNYNWLIQGGSGSGKSFWFGTYCYNLKINDPNTRVYIIDLDNSYSGICEAFNGHSINFDIGNPDTCFNPFHVTASRNQLENEIIQMQRIALEQFLVDRSNEQTHLPPEQVGQIETLLTELAQSRGGGEFYLSDVRRQMEKIPALRQLSYRLSRYCAGGVYGSLFDGPTNVDLSNPFLVFDLQKSKDNPEIAPIILTTVANIVAQMGDRYINTKKLLAFEEAAQILDNPTLKGYIELAFRTYRKKGFSVGGISQSITDWSNLPNSGAFANNLKSIIIAKLDAESTSSEMQELQSFLALPDSAIDMINSLQTVPGEYSEFVLIERTNHGVVVNKLVNRPSPLFYALQTTSPDDKAEIQKIRDEEGISLVDAKIKFSKKYPHGK